MHVVDHSSHNVTVPLKLLLDGCQQGNGGRFCPLILTQGNRTVWRRNGHQLISYLQPLTPCFVTLADYLHVNMSMKASEMFSFLLLLFQKQIKCNSCKLNEQFIGDALCQMLNRDLIETHILITDNAITVTHPHSFKRKSRKSNTSSFQPLLEIFWIRYFLFSKFLK